LDSFWPMIDDGCVCEGRCKHNTDDPLFQLYLRCVVTVSCCLSEQLTTDSPVRSNASAEKK